MSLIEWRAHYSLGVLEVDQEHQELIETINALYETALQGGSGSDVAHFLGDLYAQISAHFALEEKLMRRCMYDEYETHKADHEALLEDIRDLMDDYDGGVYVDVERFGRRLDHWFTEHFRTHDARLHGRLG